MDSTEQRIELRDSAIGRLNQLTTWIGVAAVAAVGVLAGVAWATIPGKASPPSQTAQSPSVPTTSSSDATSPLRHHHRDGSSISSSSGPPMAVSGASH